MVKRAGKKANLPFQCDAHQLRHSTGFKLAAYGHDTRSIQDYLGIRTSGTGSNTPNYRQGRSGFLEAKRVGNPSDLSKRGTP
jgi:integrase